MRITSGWLPEYSASIRSARRARIRRAFSEPFSVISPARDPMLRLFHQRAATILFRPERIFSGNGGDHFQEIPFRLRFIWLLDLEQVERMDFATVGPNV